MKKIKSFITLLGCVLPLMGCSFGNYFSAFDSFGSLSSSTSSSSSSTSSSSTSSSSSSSSSIYVDYKVERLDCLELQETFYTGYTYYEQSDFEIFAFYDDGGCELISADLCEFEIVTMQNGNKKVPDSGMLEYPGLYDVTMKVSYTENGVTATQFLTYQRNVISVLENNLKNQKGIELVSHTEVLVGDIIKEDMKGVLKLIWEDNTYELLDFDGTTDYVAILAYSENDPNTDVGFYPLNGELEYNIVVRYKNFETNFRLVFEGIIKFDANNFKINFLDFETYNSTPEGNNKMLVIPIAFPTQENVRAWTNNDIDTLERTLIAEDEMSLKYYYENASFGKVSFESFITDIYYVEDLTLYEVKRDYDGLFKLISNAVDWVKEYYESDINWGEFDLNTDGYIDNLYVITNYGGASWQDSLWPHRSTLLKHNPDINSPMPNSYILSAITHFRDPVVIIHEQGHSFGLNDYYDYSNGGSSYINYVGCGDMQSHNMFDWNAYSKLSVGWLNPYVVTGNHSEVTITIKPSATSGDCILIPADFRDWNKSAFDEYFVLELFTKSGLNVHHWNNYNQYYNRLGTGGVKLYHVDCRIYQLESPYGNGQEIDYERLANNGYYEQLTIGANNSSDYKTPGYGNYNPAAASDFKQLTLIQKGGIDTFGANDGRLDAFSQNDLFLTGDKFTFSKYSHFLSKSGVKRTAMNSGIEFPYTIEFLSVSETSATIRISK